jgi:tRNA pseudouridine55 synthase
MANSPAELHGLLLVDKPGRDPAQPDARLYTSHDVVARVRRWSGQRRIGHTGTLDPMASGLLVLCLGQATRLVEYYQGHEKRYTAQVALGTATDSYDAEGEVSATAPVPRLTEAQIEAALARFRGPIQQLPPVYSALKQGGEALYAKARRGETVTVSPRPVTIHRLRLVDWTPTSLTLDVTCSAGAYIRSLAHDLGEALGTVAHLAALRRVAAGSFHLAQAATLDELEATAQRGGWAERLLPLGAGLDMPQFVLDEATVQRLGFGQHVPLAHTLDAAQPLAVAVDTAGNCLGIMRQVTAAPASPASPSEATAVWKAEKWFTHARE